MSLPGIAYLVCGTLVLFNCLRGADSEAQQPKIEGARIVFYNVENLFDIHDDTLTDDNEFLPSGTRHWTRSRYTDKINSIAKVLIASGEWELPAVIGLCEIENRKVLEDLVYSTPLSRASYGIIHHDSPDPRGIDVALLYRSDMIEIQRSAYFAVRSPDGSLISTREFLFASCRAGAGTFNIIVCHLPSRRGGVLETEGLRRRVATFIKEKVDSIYQADGKEVPFIIAGDFNTGPDDILVSIFTDALDGISFTLLNETRYTKGTYKYQGQWEHIDLMLVSSEMTDTKLNGIKVKPGSFRIMDDDFLLQKDENFVGFRPRSTWWGMKYNGGFSDHLPVLFDLTAFQEAD